MSGGRDGQRLRRIRAWVVIIYEKPTSLRIPIGRIDAKPTKTPLTLYGRAVGGVRRRGLPPARAALSSGKSPGAAAVRPRMRKYRADTEEIGNSADGVSVHFREQRGKYRHLRPRNNASAGRYPIIPLWPGPMSSVC